MPTPRTSPTRESAIALAPLGAWTDAQLSGQAALEAAFAPAFLANVPRAEIDAGIRTLAERFGRCEGHRLVGAGGLGVRAELACERGTVHLEFHLEDTPPHRIDAFVSPDLM